jgi:hypothetical protein
MNREQKIAWFFVINFTIAIILALIAFVILYIKFGMPKASAGVGLLGLCGLSGLSPLFFKKDPGPVESDERDKDIIRKAGLASFTAAYLFVGLACMIPFTILGHRATISITWLPQIFMGAGITSFYIRSIVLLILYGKSETINNIPEGAIQ